VGRPVSNFNFKDLFCCLRDGHVFFIFLCVCENEMGISFASDGLGKKMYNKKVEKEKDVWWVLISLKSKWFIGGVQLSWLNPLPSQTIKK
jgi:hypothetical protein